MDVEDPTNPAGAARLLNRAIHREGSSTATIATALGHIARARGVSQTAREIGMTRAGIQRSLRLDGDPRLSTVLRLLRAYGVELSFRRRQA
ncbi:addiction module antidote protein [Algiphilus sp.]|uniref:addiction module antidote protein n=1 Tax=Algiphilus sp. TaxID=1872431 RepID=UPI0032ECBB39